MKSAPKTFAKTRQQRFQALREREAAAVTTAKTIAVVNKAGAARIDLELHGDRKNWRETKALAYELAARCIRDSVDSQGRPVYEGALYVEQFGECLFLIVFETMGGFDTDRANLIATVNKDRFNRDQTAKESR